MKEKVVVGLFREEAKGTGVWEKGKVRVKGLKNVKGWSTTPRNFP